MLRDDEIPDLNAIPREEWKAALKPLCEMDRRKAVGWIRGSMETVNEGIALIGYLMLEDPPPIRDIPTPSLPAGPRGVEAPPRHRAVSFRLSTSQYARLHTLAEALAMKPTTLARMMVVRGVDQALREREA